MQEYKVDYHIHTTFSGGGCTPTQIVRQAAEQEMDVIAITDRDSIGGLAEAKIAGEAAGLRVIPGIEITAETGEGVGLHILGYGIDGENVELKAFLDRLSPAGEKAGPRAPEALEVIRKAGGTPVLAHPIQIRGIGEPGSEEFFANLEKIIAGLKRQGLKGLECFHPSHSEGQTLRLIAIAEKYHLHITKGTGFHGSDYVEACRAGNTGRKEGKQE